MLTAESLVAKVVTFIVGKTIGKLAALSGDKRKKACRVLTKLYYCVQTLDDATETIRSTYDALRKGSTSKAQALAHALNNHMHDVALATNMFIDLGRELHAGLEIIDPALAECCQILYVGKGDFLHFMSNSVRWERHGLKSTITLKRPSGRMELVDMESMYTETTIELAKGDKYYWPESAFDEFSTDFADVAVTFEDDKAAEELYEMIFRQSALLKQAKELLRNLIREKFSIEEVLFQSDSHPYR